MKCKEVLDEFEEDITEIVKTQKVDNKEALFFIYDDGSTSDIFEGGPTSISLDKSTQYEVVNDGNLVGSVHTHPTGFNPSTIDIMTGLMTDQDYMCIATPTRLPRGELTFTITCIDISHLGRIQTERMLRSMRRSSVGITDVGRIIRKNLNIRRFNVTACRQRSTTE